MSTTKTINVGPVGIKPKGAYSASATYTLLDCVLYNHDSWVCTAKNQAGEPIEITGQAPADGSQYKPALTDGGRADNSEVQTAEQKGNSVEVQGNNAATKAQYAETQGDYAKAQGDYAKEWNDHPPYIGDGRNGDKDYWYLWVNHEYVKSSYAKGDDIDWNTMTPEEYQRLVENVKQDLVFATDITCETIIDELS
jgi:hypothetical protein